VSAVVPESAQVPEDVGAREAILVDLAQTQFVEAGAGSGKTTMLVGRIVRLVVRGQATIEQIAAITFTEAAAAELRERITEELERVAAGDHDDVFAAAWDEDQRAAGRQRADEARSGVDGAGITTLHGFARRILSEHPLEAGMAPVIEVLDDVQSSVSFNERWRSFLDELLSDPAYEEVLLRAFVCGITSEHLRALALQLNDHWDLLGPIGPVPSRLVALDPAPIVGPLRVALGLAGCCTESGDPLLEHLERIAPIVERLGQPRDELEVLEIVDAASERTANSSLKKWSTKSGQKGNWAGRKPEVAAALQTAQDATETLRQSVLDEVLVVLVGALTALVRRGVDARQRDGRLEVHDLLVHARDLVRSDPSVRDALHRRYRYVFIDEFQDTDPIQIELAARLAARPGSNAAEWTELDLEPGHLFFVGDPMQSIYGFRRADVARFAAARDHFVSSPLQLVTNYRSVQGIVDWVNALFASMIGDGEPGVQSRHEPLRSVRPALGDRAPVVVFGGAGAKGENAATVRSREASEVAEIIETIRDEGWLVGDEKRPARLNDITILIPARTALASLQDALDDRDLAYQLETSSLVYTSREVQELLVVLRAIADPSDEVSILGALRSALFGCGDDDLMVFRTAGGVWDYRVAAPASIGTEHPVERARASLRALHEGHRWRDVSELIESVLTQRWAFGLALDEARPRELFRRLRFVADQARRFSNAFGGDLRRYLDWTDVQATDEVRVTEVVLPESDHDAVRVMTIHSAKGLEFPIVILAGLGTAQPPQRGARVLGELGAIQVSLRKSLRTSGFEVLDQAETRKDRAERQRLLYVAATRARDHLVVGLHRSAQAPENLASLVDAEVEAFAPLWRRPTPSAAVVAGPAPPETNRQPKLSIEAFATEREQWRRGHADRLSLEGRPSSISATRAVKLVMAERETQHETQRVGDGVGEDLASEESGSEPSLDEINRWRKGRAGTEFGRAVHATLQMIDLETGARLSELARASAVVEGIGHRSGDIERVVASALESPTVRSAIGARHWREFYVGVPIGGQVLEGFLDLLIERDGGFEIVDYKTDQSETDAEIDGRMERYRFQGAAYALAVERATGQPVLDCTFLFVRPSGAVARPVVDLEEAKAAVGRIFTDR
jgi:ATP-dependent helicase/nuclease subunit A